MIYIKRIISQDLERNATFNIDSVREFFKLNITNGQHVFKKILLKPNNEEFHVKIQKRETRDEYRAFLNEMFERITPNEGDILIFRKLDQDAFDCEHIQSNNEKYVYLNDLLGDRGNHKLLEKDFYIVNNMSQNNETNVLDEFINWFVKQDGTQHHYFSDLFSKDQTRFKDELLNYERIYEQSFNSKLFKVNLNSYNQLIDEIRHNLDRKDNDFHEYSKKKRRHMPRAILGKKNYLLFLEEYFAQFHCAIQSEFNPYEFEVQCNSCGLFYSHLLINRFCASLLTKPFVILTGLSGSGKTKLAHAFVQWICENECQYRIIPVGADWTNREPLLGYPNALQPEKYVKPESDALDLIIQANQNPGLPHFLILDEMNLSHVERYFADFLSVMESKKEIPLYAGNSRKEVIPSKLKVPSNLFIIGTVNIDETTNMFSPKVLDRANTIEFRVLKIEMEYFLSAIKNINMDVLKSKGAGMATSFLEMASSEDFATQDIAEINACFVKFFVELKKIGAEFGYRSATEMLRLIHHLTVLDNSLNTHQKIDIAILHKLLPKLHGSRRKLCPTLETLGSFCISDDVKIIKEVFENSDFDFNGSNVHYPLSLEKIARMYRSAIDNGFSSFAEA